MVCWVRCLELKQMSAYARSYKETRDPPCWCKGSQPGRNALSQRFKPRNSRVIACMVELILARTTPPVVMGLLPANFRPEQTPAWLLQTS